MATVNLGRIKQVFKGTWSNSTAYTVDDFVVHSNECYIAIQAGTNQNPASASSYWTKIASKGADGTDVGAALSNNQIAYKNNSGTVTGLSIGTAGQFLKVNSSANGYEYGAVSSDFVKISHLVSSSGSSTTINLQNVFDDSLYGSYILHANYRLASNTSMYARFLNGSTVYNGGTDYRRSGMHMYRRNDNSENSISANGDGNGVDYMQMQGWGHNTSYNNMAHMRISGDLNIANGDFPRKYCLIDCMGVDNSGGSAGVYYWGDRYWHHFTNHGVVNGIQLVGGDNITKYSITLWGMKK